MDRLFLDANVLFSAPYRSRSDLLALWDFRDVTLCSSRYAVEEARINLAEQDQRARLDQLTAGFQLFDVLRGDVPRGVHLPEKDIPILLSAIEARATHLLTGDIRHFGRYFGKQIAHILILPPAAYMQSRRSS